MKLFSFEKTWVSSVVYIFSFIYLNITMKKSMEAYTIMLFVSAE
jgi:hypothetical protein